MKRTEEGNRYKENNPEAFEKLAKAMFLSKGKSDTTLARELAKIPASTAEDIVRLHRDDDGELYGNRAVWQKKEERGAELRERQAAAKFRYCFKDTFAYRYLDKLGIAENIVKKQGIELAIERKGIIVDTVHQGKEYCPSEASGNRQFLQKASFYQYNEIITEFRDILQTPARIRLQVFKDKFLLDVWTSGRKGLNDFPYWNTEGGYSWTQKQKEDKTKEYHRLQNEKKAEELIMLAHAPQAIKDEISGYIKKDREAAAKAREKGCWYGKDYEFKTLSEVWYGNTRLEPWKIEKELELEDFYKALAYMGLGIVCLQHSRVYEVKNIRQFVSHVNATTRQFVSDIKKGFAPATVREMVKEDLNIWLKERVRDKWTIFIRDDAPKSYPDIEVKKKAKPTIKETADVVTTSTNTLLEYIKQNTTI